MIILRQRLPRGLALMIPQRHRHNFFLQTPRLVRIVRTLLRTQRKLILHLARNRMLRAVQFGGIRHVRSAIGIQQRDHQRIFQLPARRQSEPVPPANHKRSLRHGLHPARQHNLRLIGLDHLRRAHNRLHPRPAQPVHCQRRYLNRNPRPQTNVPRPVQGVARSLLRVPEHHMIEFLRINPRALHRTLGRNRPQFLGREVLEFPAIPSKRRARPINDRNIPGF